MSGDTVLVLAAASALLAWAADLVVNPKAPCRSCKGRARHGLSRKKAFGDCLKCRARGTPGQRIRFGARAVNRAIGRKL